MDELNLNCSGLEARKPVIIYNFRWSNIGIAGGCLREQCVFKRNTGVFRGNHGYSKYNYYLIRDLTNLGADKPLWCPFNPKEIKLYFKDINRVLEKPIKWKIKESEIKGIPTLQIRLRVPNKYTWRQHLYILTRVRYLYEVPYCLYLRDAMKLQEIQKYDGGYEEAFLEVLKHLPVISSELGSFCGLFKYPADFERIIPRSLVNEFSSIEDLKKKFINLGDSSMSPQLNDIYLKSSEETYQFDPRNMFDLRWWNDYYKIEREPVYLGKTALKKYTKMDEKSLLPKYSESKERIKEWEKEIFG